MRRRLLAVAVVVTLAVVVAAGAAATLDGVPSTAMQSDNDDGHGGHDGHGGGHGDGGMEMDMQMVPNGTVVNENAEELPPGCEDIAGEHEVTIRGGVEHSEAGEMYSFDRESLDVEQCTRVTVTFVNEDGVRHQWMIHGLPAETYPMGMFNIEVHGPAAVTATFVAPGEDATLHTHCSLPQHEQKGMAMRVVVGEGGDGHHDGGGGGGHDH